MSDADAVESENYLAIGLCPTSVIIPLDNMPDCL